MAALGGPLCLQGYLQGILGAPLAPKGVLWTPVVIKGQGVTWAPKYGGKINGDVEQQTTG